MITLKKTVAVQIEQKNEKGEIETATLVFVKPKLNTILREAQEEKDEDPLAATEKRFKRIMARLVEVKGIFDEEGKAITVEDFKELDLPSDFIVAVVVAHDLAVRPNRDVDEKKESATAA